MNPVHLVLLALLAGFILLVAYRKGVFWQREPDGWSAGPIVDGKNSSIGVKLKELALDLFQLDIPVEGSGHVHYVTKKRGRIDDEGIRLRWKVDASDGARFIAQEDGVAGTVSLYIARSKVDWSGKNASDRWYAPSASVVPLEAGLHSIEVPLDGWTNTMGLSDPAAFAQVLSEPGRIGVVFGSTYARGHGVFATKPARFCLLELSILP